MRSARNLPIREQAIERIKVFREEEGKFKANQMTMFNNNPMYQNVMNYGQAFYRQQPQVNMHGNTFFNAFANQGAINQEVSYEHLDLDRVSSFVELRIKNKVKSTRTFEGPFPEWN